MIGHVRRIRLHNLGRPLPLHDERNHVEAMIERATAATQDARETAEHYGLSESAERIAWALDFLFDASAQVTRCDGSRSCPATTHQLGCFRSTKEPT